jgi:hypothetical protein
MALSNPQRQVLRRLAKSPYGCMTKFEVLEDVGHSSLRRLLKDGFVIGTREKGGLIKITQIGLDAVSDHHRHAIAPRSSTAKS